MISIIIPIFNVEKYLRQCLNSIYKLDLKNKEIILVNDGSTDGSLEIAEEFKNIYKENTILISQENKGLSGARNTGIRAATGEYLFFLDSDDFIDEKALERFFQEGIEKKQDILIGNYYEYFKGRTQELKTSSKNLLNIFDKNGDYFIEEKVKNRSFYVVAWLNLYRKNFLLENNLFFEERLLHEDNLFTLKAFRIAKKVGHSNKTFYYYRQDNPDSIMKKMTEKNYIHMMYIIEELIDFQKKIGNENKYFNRILIGIYWNIIKNGKIKNKKIFSKIKKLNLNFKERIKIFIIWIFSFCCVEKNSKLIF